MLNTKKRRVKVYRRKSDTKNKKAEHNIPSSLKELKEKYFQRKVGTETLPKSTEISM